MNRVINQYGALNRESEQGQAVEFVMQNLREAINGTIATYRLTAEETIAFEHHVMAEVGATFAENIIRKAIITRAYEKKAAAEKQPLSI